MPLLYLFQLFLVLGSHAEPRQRGGVVGLGAASGGGGGGGLYPRGVDSLDGPAGRVEKPLNEGGS